MKKFIKVIVLAMAFVLVFATLASCGKSIDNVQKKAEKEGYKVEEIKEAQLSYMNLSLVALGIDGEVEAAMTAHGLKLCDSDTDNDWYALVFEK